MGRTIEVIDPDGERRLKRQRRLFALASLASLALFAYPELKDFAPKWQALRAERKLALYLSMLKTRAILTKTPFEAQFRNPDFIEVFEVSSCGPNAQRTKLWDAKLSEFGEGVQFAEEPWVRQQLGSREPVLRRFCYDPLYGSSVSAEGLVHGGVFLAHGQDLRSDRSDHAVQLTVEGSSGDLTLE